MVSEIQQKPSIILFQEYLFSKCSLRNGGTIFIRKFLFTAGFFITNNSTTAVLIFINVGMGLWLLLFCLLLFL